GTPGGSSVIGPWTGRLSIPLIRSRSGTGHSSATVQPAAIRPLPAGAMVTSRGVGAVTAGLAALSRPGRRCGLPSAEGGSRLGAAIGGQGGDERFLRHLDGADVLHALLPLLLLLQQLALTGDVAAVALGQHVLADRADVLPGDDPGADGGLDRHLELLARDQVLELAGHLNAIVIGLLAVDDRAEGVDGVPLQQHVD